MKSNDYNTEKKMATDFLLTSAIELCIIFYIHSLMNNIPLIYLYYHIIYHAVRLRLLFCYLFNNE